MRIIATYVLVCLFLACAGCQPEASLDKASSSPKKLAAYRAYYPAKIQILPLTEFVIDQPAQEPGLRIYVSLLDSFKDQMKSPGVFRFELYNYVPRSAEQKGRRIMIWPDIDLTDAAENNKYWKDFLRAYKFSLNFEPAPNQTYILQATCLSPNGKRLLNEFEIKAGN